MDHKVSKDMISSGMTPSGEKTQADLGRTQYGSAPSPNKLMDAYKSMYEVDEAIDPMDFGKSKRTEEEKSKSRNLQSRLPNRSQNAQRKDQLKGTQVKTSTNSVDSTPKPKPSKGFGESSLDLLAAYNAVYEHHKKDADGNTIPHEDEEVNEGKIPAGLQAYLDKKKGKKEDKKDMKEEVDKFDVIFNHFISEGFSEKEAYAKMSNLTEEQIDEFLQALAPLAKGLMAGAVKVGAKAKPLATFAAKQGKALGKVDAIAKSKPKVSPGQLSLDLTGKGGMKPAPGPKSPDEVIKQGTIAGNNERVKRSGFKDLTSTDNLMKAQIIGNMMSGSGRQQKQRSGTVSASADLFDIVKGQLLDEGLSEKEIKDIMLTLTPEEIMNEMNAGPSTPVKNYGDSPNKPKILPNLGATRAKVKTTDKGTVIKGGKDTGQTPAQRYGG